MKLLELFCGTKSIGKEFEKVGFEVTSLDFDAQFKPTITADILTIPAAISSITGLIVRIIRSATSLTI